MNLPVSDTYDPVQGLRSDERAEMVATLERVLFERLRGVVSGVATSHTRHTITLHLDATTEELFKGLGDNLQEVSDQLTRFSVEAFDQGVYLIQLKLRTSRGGAHSITINRDGSVRVLRLSGPKGVDVPSTVTALEYAIHDALYIDPETGWAWGWFPCGQSSCWKGDGHDGVCEPSGYDPHSERLRA